MMLKKLKMTWIKSGVQISDTCISVPSYLSDNEKRALLDACQMAELNCLKLMNEGTATSLSYGLFRKKEFTE